MSYFHHCHLCAQTYQDQVRDAPSSRNRCRGLDPSNIIIPGSDTLIREAEILLLISLTYCSFSLAGQKPRLLGIPIGGRDGGAPEQRALALLLTSKINLCTDRGVCAGPPRIWIVNGPQISQSLSGRLFYNIDGCAKRSEQSCVQGRPLGALGRTAPGYTGSAEKCHVPSTRSRSSTVGTKGPGHRGRAATRVETQVH
jgi:hypothetical protein